MGECDAEGAMIVGLFPDLLPAGGVQLAGRHTAAVLARFAKERGSEIRILSLNDPEGEHQLSVAGVPVPFTGFGRSKRRFTSRAVGLARGAQDCAGGASAFGCSGVGHAGAIEEILPRGAGAWNRSLEADERAAADMFAARGCCHRAEPRYGGEAARDAAGAR